MDTIANFFISYLTGKSIDYLLDLINGNENQKNDLVRELENKFPEEKIQSISDEIIKIPETTVRFNYILSLLTKNNRLLNLPKISKLLGFSSPNSISKYILGKEDISFEIIEKMEDVFNVNSSFLTEESQKPFKTETGFYSIMDVLYKALEIKSKKIYFLLSDDVESRYSVIIQESDFKYMIIESYWKLHISEPPYTEYSELKNIHELYEVLIRLSTRREMNFYGRYLTQEIFSQVFSGNIYPFFIIDKTDMSFWVDDFTDINHHRITQYQNNYGDNFLNAQKEVRSFINEQQIGT